MDKIMNLSKSKQDELQKISKTIRANCDDVEMIILYGSYARGDYKEAKDIDPKSKSGHPSDYDILVVSSKKKTALDVNLWSRISKICQDLELSAQTRIITHDIKALNIKLAEGQYFFSDVKKDGIRIFDSKKFELAEERNLTANEKRRIAQDYFDECFQGAQRFYRYFNVAIDEDDFKRAAFFLHQSAESAYKAVLLVFSNYSPREHFLEFLGKEAEKYSDLMKNIFSKISKEDEERFKLLEYAYTKLKIYTPTRTLSKHSLKF
ncbi:MAG: hypothetical protein A2887_06005 [Alphaproteobacteria bacterium RIFCSPLOWO2_01_FULL_40_26]|nr:MAG: hypothetical protein A3D15_02270 [Alphaproteobacteria bacterium RIFCSPHIGHO2_02_FULL_40_34]OFW94276.1 MAG: hypothetical protein A2887_06005 [Alphaproteobacteria bacterium RIFCSPLOWO2_01_FULL_40_26]OFX09845.1 MAG: hypothetical protein A3H30_00765 [Alphaproteobacteria bacterium RIFCSPLOWO2_02_FULL_40_19]OFX11428.1 MAG: hypothetical protein A3G22_02005 [Alphaproteobacteria bacterium RIFCSPLOWO2_12_FULL_40_11]